MASDINFSIKLSYKIKKYMVKKYGKLVPIQITVTYTKGPCRDDWCPLIRKIITKIVDKDENFDEKIYVPIIIDEIKIYMHKELYEYASKHMNKIELDIGIGGLIKHKGIE
ncbi:MAG: hypothetical protein M1411_03090 [Candidatus Thermoplasmatota archaeon]|nr:hypothetical protein [Candidatus Thermoplasmatota archaeon]